MKNYYAILNVPETATAEQIKAAYRSLAKLWHPDICKASNASERFKEINEANDVLSSEESRREYDMQIAQKQRNHAPEDMDDVVSGGLYSMYGDDEDDTEEPRRQKKKRKKKKPVEKHERQPAQRWPKQRKPETSSIFYEDLPDGIVSDKSDNLGGIL